jgi:hypothetical protein
MSEANYSTIPGQAQRDPGSSRKNQGVDGRDKPGHDNR